MPTSAHRVTNVVASSLTPATKLVLLHVLTLVDRRTSIAEAPISAIAAATGLTTRGVRKSLALLTGEGLLSELKPSRTARAWTVNLAMIDDLPAAEAAS